MNKSNNKFRYQVASCWLFILRNTQKRTYLKIRIHNITKKYIIYKINQQRIKHKTIYTMIQNRTKRIRKNVVRKTAIHVANLIRTICLLIRMDTLLRRTSPHFTFIPFNLLAPEFYI